MPLPHSPNTEPRPMFGTLSRFFRPRRLTCNIARWLQMDSQIIQPADIEAGLWPCKETPGLNVLFGPQTVEECQEMMPSSAAAVLNALSNLAGYVVLDLFPALSDANRAIAWPRRRRQCRLVYSNPTAWQPTAWAIWPMLWSCQAASQHALPDVGQVTASQ
jgi:hypothetical protein